MELCPALPTQLEERTIQKCFSPVTLTNPAGISTNILRKYNLQKYLRSNHLEILSGTKTEKRNSSICWLCITEKWSMRNYETNPIRYL